MISIVDYGMGNLKSVENALDLLDIKSVITSDKEVILNSKGIILPGVGAFPDAIDCIREAGLDVTLKEAVSGGTPLLGVCLGMQLLFEESEEIRPCSGLGFLKGKIEKIKGNLKIPHMGWNSLKYEKACPILKDIEENSYVYFVHSYYAVVGEEGILNAYADYGVKVPGVVSKGNVFGLQFHPEKSGDVGLKMLKNFGEMIK
ncbi:imidazole glycerol phosphate synthase subunit HisH 1 [Clostridium homopropionicum DSM 5847]|uniref:Imidazole glycerol phosphate synthase subunit HisH n=1 Tax=Clostridium homopropionicum DSM 5847 TaxID=1121318 RepID=A0A0L6ZAF3_9CLOT|nr:imidazole glycerol phosphate synthase subunit HisH 1 [Clostridium homopropionicum DSM 5847]SFG88480.1 glutamine amidotransferase [Clostridium homopropionicum]